ncbi:MAG: PQQ-dependent sugar dehydrogenase [Verrucomicrobiales bacterium]|nr:PQQ-dependent sugar dehydrogenase [Verrucomicrobiales bacterium]
MIQPRTLLWCLLGLVPALCLPLTAAQTLKLRLMSEGFVSPTTTAAIPGSPGRTVVADQTGVARIMERDGTMQDDAFLDLRPRMVKLNTGFDERGLLGLVLHPKFASNGKVYASYSAPRRESVATNWDSTLRISEFTAKGKPAHSVDLTSERVILEIDKPYFNHNGGCIAFGPDGHLYIAVGDGGNGNGQGIGHSPISNGQDLNTLLGKILRIDVDRGNPYRIPRDNPYAKSGGRPEIFAYGFRNPWRIAFDRGGDHELFAGDIGQTLYEEINLVLKGGNYGWFIREGTACFNPADAPTPKASCATHGADGKPLIDPIIAYKNPNGFRKDESAIGISVMGGYVYRGKAIPALQGRYVFGDWSRAWALPEGVFLLGTRPAGAEKSTWAMETLGVKIEDGLKWKAYITGFGEDSEGELYVMTNASNGLVGKTGKVYKIVGID